MKKVIVFVDYLDNLAFDAAKMQLEAGHEVFILYCSESTKICKANYGKSALICKLCVYQTEKKLRDFRNDNHCHIKSMDELMTPAIIDLAKKQQRKKE